MRRGPQRHFPPRRLNTIRHRTILSAVELHANSLVPSATVDISRKCRASATFVRFVVIGTFCSPVSPSNTHQPALNPPIDKRKSSSWRVGAVGMVFADPWLQAAESSLH
ncbi:hypothetical protein EFD56_32420, partial [Rhizobium phaseoli]